MMKWSNYVYKIYEFFENWDITNKIWKERILEKPRITKVIDITQGVLERKLNRFDLKEYVIKRIIGCG